MSDPHDLVLAYWAEHRTQLRQCETQRSVLTNYILVIVAALTGLIVQQQVQPSTLPLSILIVLIGLYGALAVAKYHERADYHLTQARALTRTLIDAGALPDHSTPLELARQAHHARYPRLQRLRLHRLWTGMHLAIAAYGAVLAVVIVTR
jgi:hypothetical protein